jgi:endonuclease YncB( thermonuclease family)
MRSVREGDGVWRDEKQGKEEEEEEEEEEDEEGGHEEDVDGHWFDAYDSNTPLFSLDNLGGKTKYGMRPARLVGAHDGDTVSVVIRMYGENGSDCAVRFNVRMNGIDTPEMFSPVPEEKVNATLARNRLISILTRGIVELIPERKYTRNEINARLCEHTHIVYMKTHGMDKYGRVLADVYANPEPVEPPIGSLEPLGSIGSLRSLGYLGSPLGDLDPVEPYIHSANKILLAEGFAREYV